MDTLSSDDWIIIFQFLSDAKDLFHLLLTGSTNLWRTIHNSRSHLSLKLRHMRTGEDKQTQFKLNHEFMLYRLAHDQRHLESIEIAASSYAFSCKYTSPLSLLPQTLTSLSLSCSNAALLLFGKEATDCEKWQKWHDPQWPIHKIHESTCSDVGHNTRNYHLDKRSDVLHQMLPFLKIVKIQTSVLTELTPDFMRTLPCTVTDLDVVYHNDDHFHNAIEPLFLFPLSEVDPQYYFVPRCMRRIAMVVPPKSRKRYSQWSYWRISCAFLLQLPSSIEELELDVALSFFPDQFVPELPLLKRLTIGIVSSVLHTDQSKHSIINWFSQLDYLKLRIQAGFNLAETEIKSIKSWTSQMRDVFVGISHLQIITGRDDFNKLSTCLDLELMHIAIGGSNNISQIEEYFSRPVNLSSEHASCLFDITMKNSHPSFSPTVTPFSSFSDKKVKTPLTSSSSPPSSLHLRYMVQRLKWIVLSFDTASIAMLRKQVALFCMLWSHHFTRLTFLSPLANDQIACLSHLNHLLRLEILCAEVRPEIVPCDASEFVHRLPRSITSLTVQDRAVSGGGFLKHLSLLPLLKKLKIIISVKELSNSCKISIFDKLSHTDDILPDTLVKLKIEDDMPFRRFAKACSNDAFSKWISSTIGRLNKLESLKITCSHPSFIIYPQHLASLPDSVRSLSIGVLLIEKKSKFHYGRQWYNDNHLIVEADSSFVSRLPSKLKHLRICDFARCSSRKYNNDGRLRYVRIWPGLFNTAPKSLRNVVVHHFEAPNTSYADYFKKYFDVVMPHCIATVITHRDR